MVEVTELKKGGWLKSAINPKHKGFCTPLSKKTCTPHRKALARRFKSGDLSKKEDGGKVKYLEGGKLDDPKKKMLLKKKVEMNVVMDKDGIKLDNFRQKLNNITKKGGL
jgi:hypothetical protein